MTWQLSRLVLVAAGLALVGLGAAGKELAPKDAGFSIDLPAEAVETKQAVRLPEASVEVRIYLAQLNPGRNYLVAYCDLPAESLQAVTPDARLDRARDDAVKAADATLVSEKKIKLGDVPGRDLVLQLPDNKGFVRSRLYLAKNRLFQVVVTGDRQQVTGPEADKYLNTFKLVGG